LWYAAKPPCPDRDAKSFPSVRRRSLSSGGFLAARIPRSLCCCGAFFSQYAWKAATAFSLAQRLVHARVPGPAFGIRAVSSAAARASWSAASFPLIQACPGTQRIITAEIEPSGPLGPATGCLRKGCECCLAGRRCRSHEGVSNLQANDKVVGEFGSYRATCFLEPFSAATASASKTSACRSGCLPRVG
jgi:hypothetical protein